MDDELAPIQSPAGLAADVRSMIDQTRSTIASVANAGLTLLYWRIGKRIDSEVLGSGRADYGDEIVATLSRQLVTDFGSEAKLHAAIEISKARFAERGEEDAV